MGLKPLIITAIGSVSATTKETLHQLVTAASLREEDAQVRVDFRHRLFGRLSVLLVKYGRIMLQDQIKFIRSHNRSGSGVLMGMAV